MSGGFRDRTGLYVAKKALYDTAVTLWETTHPDFVQVWGFVRSGALPSDRYVEWGGGESDQEPATVSPNRSRTETVRIESTWWSIIRGEVDAARDAEEYLYDRIGEIERHIRYTDPNLGGVALHCALSRVMVDTADAGPLINQFGMLAAAAVTFEAKIRITG